MNKEGKLVLSLSQIFILTLAIFSFAFIISESERVSAQDVYYWIDRGNIVGGTRLTAPAGTTLYLTEDRAKEALLLSQSANNQNKNSVSALNTVTGAGGVGVIKSISPTNIPFTLPKDVKVSLQDNTVLEGTGNIIKKYDSNSKSYQYFLKEGGSPLNEAEKTALTEALGYNPFSATPTPGTPGFEYSANVPLIGSVAGVLGHVVEGAMWAGFVVGLIQLAGAVGLGQEYTGALTKAALAGITAGKLSYVLFGDKAGVAGGKGFLVKGGSPTAGISSQTATMIGIGVAAAVFILTYKKEKIKAVSFQCLPFEPSLGGKRCEECNNNPFEPCSEYRCKSLGQACDLVNKGTEDESCVWINKGDVNSPTITPWGEPLTENHRYIDHGTLPPSLGSRIVRDGVADGCLQAFTPLSFGIITNEPAQCKIDLVHRDNYEQMTFYFGETNLYLYNHTQRMSLPGPDSLNAESPELQNNGQYDLYVRCRDANGNFNVQEYAFQFCVDPSPDTTPPVIVDSSIVSGSPVAYQTDKTTVDFYINEPAQCKWSTQDKSYEDMENPMVCSTAVSEINARQLYTCATELTGIRDRQENKYFLRCKDQPSKPENERNVNVQSKEFVLRGSQPLNIIKTSPENEKITGSNSIVGVNLQVETSNGADEGRASCYFSNSGLEGSYIQMFETNNFVHKQVLSLGAGNYQYYFRCVDAGGNSDTQSISFEVEVDTVAPHVTRAYKDLDALKIITDEDAKCVYSLNSCNYNFEEGIALIYSNPSFKQRHFAPWKANTAYYIKCADDFGNQPNPNECSIIVSGANII